MDALTVLLSGYKCQANSINDTKLTGQIHLLIHKTVNQIQLVK